MSEDALIRRQNLRALGKLPSELAKDIGSGYSYWAALVAEGSKKAFGEKIARRIEARYHLPRGCFDIPGGVNKNAARDPSWPFDRVARERYEALDDVSKGFVQARMLDEIEKQEERVEANRKAA